MDIAETIFLVKLKNLEKLSFISEKGIPPFSPIVIETDQAKFFIRETLAQYSEINAIFSKYPDKNATAVIGGILTIKNNQFVLIALNVKFIALPDINTEKYESTEISPDNLEEEDSRVFIFEGSDPPPDPTDLSKIASEINEQEIEIIDDDEEKE